MEIRLSNFNYKDFIDNSDFGEANEELVARSKIMANAILHKLNLGLYINDFRDVDWYDGLWHIHDDVELFNSTINLVLEMLGESIEMKKFRDEVVRYEWNKGTIHIVKP